MWGKPQKKKRWKQKRQWFMTDAKSTKQTTRYKKNRTKLNDTILGLALQLDFIHSSILSSIHPFNSFHLIWPKILIFPFPNFRFLIFYPVRETKKWNEKKRNNKVCHWMMQRNCNCTYKWMNNNNNKIRYTFHHFFVS